jgi:glycosyltransferase involved in cell wall biosynthesis
MWAGQCDSSISIDKPYVVYVGQRSGYKNFELLISTFASSNFLKENFKIIAFGGGKFDGIECQKFHELGLSEGTIQHVTGNDYILRELYQRARAFIYPSLYEGFGLPVLEALTSGCPTFCSNSGSIPEVGGDAVVYFDPTKLEDLKTKLEHYLQSDTALKAFKALGKMQAAKFSWDLTAKKTSEAYSNVL